MGRLRGEPGRDGPRNHGGAGRDGPRNGGRNVHWRDSIWELILSSTHLLAALTVMMMVIGPTGATFAAEEADVAEKAAEEEAKEAEAICIACNGSTTDT